ncbi:MAG: cbb3-type cytochrome c oxidase subunit I [Planctomycetes bacterium]|nr:cbb3-type cytochrome c oxidase subunit I [Planctomycetota bacterium]
MSDSAHAAEAHTETAHAVHRHPAPTGFIAKYVFSVDHKVIGKQYWFLALFASFMGMALSLWFRWHLAYPEQGLLTPEGYLAILTMHGTIMVFMVLTTAPQGGFGNYALPIQIGAEDMAFPRLNMLSFWLTLLSLIILLAAFFVGYDAKNWVPGPGSGWTGYAPLSVVEKAQAGKSGAWPQTMWVLSIAVFCLASLIASINFIVTTLDLRCKGMTLMRMPLTVWAWFVTAIISLLAFGVLLAGGLLLLLDRHLGTSFFVPGNLFIDNRVVTEHTGGSPLLWQHLFWFFGHPEVYIAILPGMGLASHLLANFARKPIFGYAAMVYAIFAIALLGFFVWGHHMFQSGMHPMTAVVFSVLTMIIGVPSAIKTFNWLGTLWNSKIRFDSPMLYALGFVSLFVTGGLGGIFLGQNAADVYFHDTYFVVGHFHMIMGVAAIFGIFAGSVYWFPKMFGRMMNERMSQIHFFATFIGVYLIFVPMHFVGLDGHPRRYAGFEFAFLKTPEMIAWHKVMTHGAIMTAVAQLVLLVNIFYSLFNGPKAPANPWEATSLEWGIPSPPPHDNFAGVIPVVNHGPYEYSVPGAPRDFIMQTDAPDILRHSSSQTAHIPVPTNTSASEKFPTLPPESSSDAGGSSGAAGGGSAPSDSGSTHA